jgi:hypothetical protein
MSQLVKTKRQANFEDCKGFGAFKGLVEQKNVVFNSFVCKLGLFGTRSRSRSRISLLLVNNFSLLTLGYNNNRHLATKDCRLFHWLTQTIFIATV